MSYIKGTASQPVFAEMIDATTGGAFAGTVSVYLELDGGTQALGSVNSGLATSKGNGSYQYLPSAAEFTADVIKFTFTGTGAVPYGTTIATITQAQASSLATATSTSRTVRDQITAAAFDLGLLQSGEVLNPDDLQFAFSRFNDWIDFLKTQNLSCYTITRTTWTLTTATSYTVGLAGTIAIDRPVSPNAITNTGYIDTTLTNTPEYQLGNVLTEDQYAALIMKGFSSPYPQRWYYSPTYPLGTLRPWPIPSNSGLQGVLYTETPVAEFATVDDAFALPPGYRRFFRTNLAIELAAAFDTQPSPTLVQAASESRQAVKLTNVRLVDLTSNAAGVFSRGRPYNIFTDT
jgi:hypothetical protein